MPTEAVQPLRISKASPARQNGSSPSQRALAEISPMERRRNSPSWNQATKSMMTSRDSSPFDSSTYLASPRPFWNGKLASSSPFNENAYARPESPSAVRRRTSIEKLKKASRVKNSSMFAREHKGEYDPTSPVSIERPLAAGRPLSLQVQGNAYGGRGLDGMRKENPSAKGHRRGESQTNIQLMGSSTTQQISENQPSPLSPARNQASPTKSSLSSKQTHNTFPRNFDPNSAIWSEEDSEGRMSPPRALRRQAKSVTFDVAPPQINEYEMVTPDPSSVASGSRESSYDIWEDEEPEPYDMDHDNRYQEDSFDASLEDTEKTPVVLPEDWRGMSPEVEVTPLAINIDDPFVEQGDGRSTPSKEWNKHRTASTGSDADSRPLPPVPQFLQENGSRRNSGNILERVHNAHRSLPAPPPAASVSKSDILSMKNSAMSLEDRLRLMGLREPSAEKTSPTQADREKARLQRHGLGIHVQDDEMEHTKHDELPDFKFPHISRESILKKVRSRNFDEEDKLDYVPEDEYDVDQLDPDVPIPSREASSNFDENVGYAVVKEEQEEDLVDLYSIPAMYGATDSHGEGEDDEEFDRDGSVIHHPSEQCEAEGANTAHSTTAGAQKSSRESIQATSPSAPRPEDMIRVSTPPFDAMADGDDGNVGLPEFSTIMDETDFQAGLQSYMSTGSDEPAKKDVKSHEEPPSMMDSVHQYLQRDDTPDQRLPTPESQYDNEPGSPDSVIRRPSMPAAQPLGRESPSIPEPLATIKAPGGKLKTRPSATPADLQSMAATRRQVSGSHPPPIPEKSPKRASFSQEGSSEISEKDCIDRAVAAHKKRRESFKMKLDFSDDVIGEDMSLDLDKEFNRVIESSKVDLYFSLPSATLTPFSSHGQLGSQTSADVCATERSSQPQDFNLTFRYGDANNSTRTKKGYLMRQNTKVVVAKRHFSNDRPSIEEDRPNSADDALPRTPSGSNSRKASHERAKSWTTEPWNGKVRRKSLRSVDKIASGSVPPLPGQESAVTAALDTVVEDQILQQEEVEDGAERGRLFVKVVGVKDVDLPLPQNERSWFQLTLDNGLHCVTTSRLELGRAAPIGQEFELVVFQDLEFQLTLQTLITPPAKSLTPLASPQKTAKTPTKKPSSWRLLTSPKKRRELERFAQEQREMEERQTKELRAKEAAARRAAPPTAWDLLHETVGEDGSFGRAYVCLKNHEDACFGRPITVDLPVFNEWAVEDPHISNSVKSKRGNMLRRPPYQIGKLTLQLLYVPRPKGCKDEDMPKSMNACVREMATSENAQACEWEGFLSQQGGDCPYWRRRFFRLSGMMLTAYHETTRQPRTNISLSKAAKLIDDKSTLLKPDAGNGKGGKGRRKSAFADEDQAYMFVEEGFRIRFSNGETIDFYAENASDKEGWMKALSTVVGKEVNSGKTWCDVVLRRERALRDRAEKTGKVPRPRSQGQAEAPRAADVTKSMPSSPVKGWDTRLQQHQQQHQLRLQQVSQQQRQSRQAPEPRTGSRRAQIKSMIF